MQVVNEREKLEIRAAAQNYAALALRTLVNVMRTGETDKDRVAAAKEILDRAYGKSIQAHKLDEAPSDQKNEELSSNAERFTSAIVGIASRGRKG